MSICFVGSKSVLQTDDYSHPGTFDRTPFFSAANVLTLRQDLIYFFHSNHFGVDVDDDHRIVVLTPIGGLEQDLPTHLPLQAYDPAMDEFLRLHFRFSLSVQLRGGDIRDDYPLGSILAMMDELGVPHAMTENPEECVMAALSDARWQTVLGRAILADAVKHQVTQSFRCNKSVDEDAEDDRYGSQDGISSGGDSEDRESEEESVDSS
ncbi:hypothetical protein B0H14DRAFT_3448597 [Mycena olivaceomarginata]|nr:hypothetical protein B0H14DRAFT_3448597 [Mycena olivaceomarginata]